MRGKPKRKRRFQKLYNLVNYDGYVALKCTQTGRQLRTGKDEDTQKGCQKPALQQKITDESMKVLRLGDLEQ